LNVEQRAEAMIEIGSGPNIMPLTAMINRSLLRKRFPG
jgi:hypothetical protein